jgi:alkane 1-monooxygenase
MSPLPFLFIFVAPAAVFAGHYAGGVGYFLGVIVAFGAVPSFDAVLGLNTRNPEPREEPALDARRSFRVITWVYVPVQLALVTWAAYEFTRPGIPALYKAGLVLSVGITTGAMGITIAHELIHRHDNSFERTLGLILLLTVSYSHFKIEHIHGHHVNVATPRDPASAPRGKGYYAFWPRTVFGSLASAWRIEARRMERLGRRVLEPRNRMLWYPAVTLAMAAALAAAFGPWAMLFFFAQGAIAFSLLEVVNYIEHYGLSRREVEPGRYEPVSVRHSWNAANRLTNYFLINLQRHPDHHWQPQRRYQLLRHTEESPQMPTGYSSMILLALVPPLWKRVMDRRLDEYGATDR